MVIMSPFMGAIMSFVTLSIYWVGAYLINDASMFDKIEIFSNMVVFSSYAVQVIMSFMMLIAIFIIYPRASVSAKRINEVLDIILKPFCISLRFVKDSPEKTEAFCGISKAILYKVENILSSSFSLFIDTICLYDNPSCDIENLFKKIIHDLLYNDNNCIKERFLCLYSELPLSLQNKLSMKYNNELNGYM
jgi:ABC-type multidrug transport system fused ATPase/permease subunit